MAGLLVAPAPAVPFSSTSGISSVSQADYEAAMPARVPDHTTAQKDFKSAMIVISNGLLSQTEMAYYHWQAIQNEMPLGDPGRGVNRNLNFSEASYGKASLTTELPICPDIFMSIPIRFQPILFQVSDSLFSDKLVPAWWHRYF